MSINISNPVEINVVNVGDEISSDQLAAIQGASSPSASNVFATMVDVGNGGGGTGNALPLAGGTMTGAINFGTGGQNINQGTFDNGLGGYNGISLNCAVGYELNWQAGHLKCVDSFGNPSQINLDSQISFSDNQSQSFAWINGNDFYFYNGYGNGKSLYWDGFNALHIYPAIGGIGDGVSVSSTGITFPDGSYQSTASSGLNPFDQSLNTTDSVSFSGHIFLTDPDETYNQLSIYPSGINLSGQVNGDLTYCTLANNWLVIDGVLGTTYFGYEGITFRDGSFQSTAAGGGGFDQSLNTTDNVVFNQTRVGSNSNESIQISDSGLDVISSSTTGGGYPVIASINRYGFTLSWSGSGITFPDGSFQSTAAIASDKLEEHDQIDETILMDGSEKLWIVNGDYNADYYITGNYPLTGGERVTITNSSSTTTVNVNRHPLNNSYTFYPSGGTYYTLQPLETKVFVFSYTLQKFIIV